MYQLKKLIRVNNGFECLGESTGYKVLNSIFGNNCLDVVSIRIKRRLLAGKFKQQRINKQLVKQLQDCITKHSGLFAEYELNNGDYLLVHFEYDSVNNGVLVTADFELSRHFSDEVINSDLGFTIPFEPEYFDNIDHYLQKVGDEIVEGYLLPNGVY